MRSTGATGSDLFDPPPVPHFTGFAFVEFTVDEAAASALGALLLKLGFELRGRHRTKPVVLYRQGDIHLVVNTLGHALARERFALNGPSVCALALRTTDAPGALARGTAMKSARFDPPIGPGEVTLPSLVSPGGTIFHFVDDRLAQGPLYQADFVLVSGGDRSDAGLQSIDHVALALAPDRVDTWVLFCRAVLGLEAGESLKLADPYGLVRNFGMADDGRRLRLVLNVSLSQRTRTAQAVQAGGGVTVQHVALACKDIFDAVSRLRGNGVGFTPVSDNYYDDLSTRFELEPSFVERMRAAGVLFDRTSQGDYLHAYTEPFADHFFFEIVQRTRAYDAYGAPNAPARMAAQVRELTAEG